jgi:hypothetical protein
MFAVLVLYCRDLEAYVLSLQAHEPKFPPRSKTFNITFSPRSQDTIWDQAESLFLSKSFWLDIASGFSNPWCHSSWPRKFRFLSWKRYNTPRHHIGTTASSSFSQSNSNRSLEMSWSIMHRVSVSVSVLERRKTKPLSIIRVPLLVAACLCVDCKKIRGLPEKKKTERQKRRNALGAHFLVLLPIRSWHGLCYLRSRVKLDFRGSNPGILPLPFFVKRGRVILHAYRSPSSKSSLP